MTKEEALEKLKQSDLPIEEVQSIYESFKEDKEVVAKVAMNLSLKTSVYDREKGKSPIMTQLLIELSKTEDMASRWAVAKNPHTPVDILCQLAKDEVNLVRALVATNPNTPQEVLQELFEDEKIVRDGLSGNPSAPADILEALADDEDKLVRLRVAENPATSLKTLQKLLNDSDPDVAKAAQIKIKERNG